MPASVSIPDGCRSPAANQARPEASCLRVCEEAKKSSDGRFHLGACRDDVDHAVFDEELRALESVRKCLTDGLLDHSRSGEPDERLRLRQIEIAKHGVR